MPNFTAFPQTNNRLLAARLARLHAHFPVVVVSGARQVGKTTLLQHQFPDYDYVCFDPALDLENARSEPELFLDNHKPPVILDEIQYAPELVAAIKRRVDANAHASSMYLLSGSQQWQVLKVLAESLAGRVAFLDLHGFSLPEIAQTSNSWLANWLQDSQAFVEQQHNYYSGELTEWLWRGCLPRAQSLPLDLVPDFWAAYHRTYIERDARLAGAVDNWQDFGRFVQLLSALTAQELNKSALGREIGLSARSSQRWLRILLDTYQYFELPAYSNNLTSRVKARSKGHIADSGLACHHAQLARPTNLGSHPLFGAVFESAMVSEIRKQAQLLPTAPQLYHWRTRGGAEVDLLLEINGTLYPFEIKLTSNPGKRHCSGIHALRKRHPNTNIAPAALICSIPKPRRLSPNVIALPWNLL